MKPRMVSHYKILACLGGGAMGTVYKAEDTLLHRPVALKFLPSDLTEDEEASRRFMREARATSTLDHPNICTIHEIAQADDGSWYIAMAWYEGKTLKRILRDGPLSPDQALGLAQQIARGLGQAHDHGVVHRDIKPANLIVTDDGTLKILDFGLARLLGMARLTRTGTVMGTAAYMSPEQARGEDVGTSSDIWSLGIVLYEMLTGRVPYDGESDVAMIYAVLNTDPTPLPEPVGKEARICHDIINHCLVRNPKDRYPSAHVLAEDIENATDGSKASYHSRSSKSSIFALPDGRRWPRLIPAVLGVLLLAALVIPQSREFLRSVTGLGRYDKLGVAVTPFVFEGDQPADKAFGRGLSASVTERLVNFEPHTDKFWVVPLEEILRRQITDERKGREIEGADRVITGVGSVVGDTISLTLTVHDTNEGKQVVREFRDLGGNLKTWQEELPAWVAGVVEPGFALPPGVSPRPRGTNIPAAFLHYQRGFGYLARENLGKPAPLTAEAIPHLEKAVASDSSFTCAWTQLGRAIWLRDRNVATRGVDQAEEYLGKAISIDSTIVWASSYLGDLEAWRGDDQAAQGHFQQALRHDPNHVPTINKLAALFLSENRMEEAEAQYRHSVQARPRYARAHRDLGLFRYFNSDFEGARDRWRQWAELTPNDFAAYSLLGVASFQMEDYPYAEEMFLRSLDIEPSAGVYENLATLYYYDQRYIDSIAMARRALARKPNEFTTWRTLAAAFKFAPGYGDSVRPAYEKAMELLLVQRAEYPRDPELMADHASFCAILGPREQALTLLEELEAENPSPGPDIMFNMASTYEELGQRERALDWLEAGVEKELSFKKVDHYPVLKDLRTHPRYIALRNKYEE